jgi:SAM-dependent methyltransferase
MNLRVDASLKPRRAVKMARNAARDLRFGAVLGGTVKTRYAHLGAFDTANSDYDDLPPLFAAADVHSADVIVDIGCGKGRVLNWVLAHYSANRVYGIELDPEVAARTAKRLRRYPRADVVTGDAASLVPRSGTILFLFNPFDETVMRRFVATLLELEASDDAKKRRIIYCRCKFLEPFRESDRFVIEPIELPSKRHEAALITLEPAR